MNLYNREPVKSAALWVDDTMQDLWGQQRDSGIISGVYPDGNFARTSIMYALWKTQGVHVEPWRADVRVGAVLENGTLYVSLAADGRLALEAPARGWSAASWPESACRSDTRPASTAAR